MLTRCWGAFAGGPHRTRTPSSGRWDSASAYARCYSTSSCSGATTGASCSDSQHCSIEALSQSGPAPAGRTRSKSIEDDLVKAKARVAALEQKLLDARSSESRGEGKEVSWSPTFFRLTQRRAQPLEIWSELRPCDRATDTGSMRSWFQIRIWMDGAFDMLHYGHMNAFRQGRAYGTYLVVGVNSDGAHRPKRLPFVLQMRVCYSSKRCLLLCSFNQGMQRDSPCCAHTTVLSAVGDLMGGLRRCAGTL